MFLTIFYTNFSLLNMNRNNTILQSNYFNTIKFVPFFLNA